MTETAVLVDKPELTFNAIYFTEFSNNTIMTAETRVTDSNFNGAPAPNMPYRSETFNYQYNKKISNLDRLVTQGRINPKTKNPADCKPDEGCVGPHYWASYQQNKKKRMSAKTTSCEDRYTWLTFINGSSNTYSYIVDLTVVEADIIALS
jgi:chromosomal replication initiation ATPase DnaA